MTCDCMNSLNSRVFEVTGCRNVDELLNKLQEMQEAYLLDDTFYDEDDEECTVPLLQQIEKRLDMLEEMDTVERRDSRRVDEMVSVQEEHDADLYINLGRVIKDAHADNCEVNVYKRVLISGKTVDDKIRVYKLWES